MNYWNYCNMELKGTHNSGTGERGKGFLSLLVAPFAKCQRKTIKEQYDAGCRVFDLRVKWVDGKWRLAHGAWVSEVEFLSILDLLNGLEGCYVILTYEGRLDEGREEWFVRRAKAWKAVYRNVKWLEVNVKKGENGKWTKLVDAEHKLKTVHGFIALDFSSWHTLLPIPWLWWKLGRKKDVKVKEGECILVDFL